MASIYLQTFGCQMNAADSNGIAHQAWSMGCTFTTNPEQADIIILNTCAIREKAESRAYGRIGQFKALKEKNPAAKLLVCGCLAQKDRALMRERAPFIDALLGPREYGKLKETLTAWGVATDAPPPDALFRAPAAEEDPGQGGFDEYAHLRALVNITRGCEKFCTYCIVPYTRGPLESIPPEEIEAQIKMEVRRGAREITLLGQNVNSYYHPASKLDFSGLLLRVGAIQGLTRLTFLTSHPKDFGPDVVDALSRLPNVCPRLHLPMQCGSNPVLRAMARLYTIEEYLEKIEHFRARLPGWALTTDIIVGYPTETEADFLRTLDVVQRGTFESAYIFSFSPRAGTPAATMMPQVDPKEKIRRLQAVNAAQNEATRRFHESFVGETVSVLVQGPSKKDATRLAGKTGHNTTVVWPRDGRTDGMPLVDVTVERAFNWGLAGQAA
ncbi:MAG: tRNA (N6-isopentenyl adenosine(37)-C2)-methylthiotransferase MiaB [Candidatus Eremiobacteraeota bacterium]|nr:tRNA (N6-isopentenyl adenosine(37)-C2)-methylthiotransferase MiaB [Candidatus Eremiobacteraeota bacterium]MBC5827020.1 tRNA (N6-isopentenyl adenosine(37)-C2)-methylthiotransferase MiaB [Candidatus Eremiobacteraeota bacterium]